MIEAVADTEPDSEFDVVACDICGHKGLNGEEHTYSDLQRYDRWARMVNQEYTTDQGTVNMCEGCRDDYVYVEDACELCPPDDAAYVQDLDAWYTSEYAERNFHCDQYGDWFSEANDDDNPSLAYEEKVTDYFHSPIPFGKRLVMGVELEVEARSSYSAGELVAAIDGPVGHNFICTHDGSLVDGTEVNCMPYTLDEHKAGKGMRWESVLQSLRRCGIAGDNSTSCGMHVHINRRALTALQIGKMLVFVNSEKNNSKLERIFQRTQNDYCESITKKITDVRKSRRSGRTERLNVSGDMTVELRAFKANLRYERVMKNLEFCHAMVIFCRDVSMRNIENWRAFTAFVATRRKTYKYLYAFMHEKGLTAS